jgi:hypothetical protein
VEALNKVQVPLNEAACAVQGQRHVCEVGQEVSIDQQQLDHRVIRTPCLSASLAAAAPDEKDTP